MNDSHSGIPLEADDSGSSDLGPFEADEKDVKREESNFHVPLQAGLPWFTLVLGCIWVYHLHFPRSGWFWAL